MRTLSHVPIFQKAYNLYRVSFFVRGEFPVRGWFRCRAIENTGCAL